MAVKGDYLKFRICMHPFFHEDDIVVIHDVDAETDTIKVKVDATNDFYKILLENFGAGTEHAVCLPLGLLPFYGVIIEEESIDISDIKELLWKG